VKKLRYLRNHAPSRLVALHGVSGWFMSDYPV